MSLSIRATLILGVFAAWNVISPSVAAEQVADGISNLSTPWVIAHRGGPMTWPEETMEAYEASTKAGNAFVEVDCWLLSGDKGIGLMHDPSLARTTNRKEATQELTALEWGQLKVDGKKLLGSNWGYYHAPFLDEVIVRFRNQKILFIESKDGRSGAAIVEKLKLYKVSKDFVVVNAFQATELRPAIRAGYKTCLNLTDMNIPASRLKRAGYWSVCCPPQITEEYVKSLKNAGLKVIASPVNRHFERDELLRWGIDGFYTDDPLYQAMDQKYRRDTDPFDEQKFAPGMLDALNNGRGYFTQPNKWGVDTSSENVYRGCLQGWMGPIQGVPSPSQWTMDLSITFGAHFNSSRWAGVTILTTDAALNDDFSPRFSVFGYNILFHYDGGISVYRYDGAVRKPAIKLAESKGALITSGETIHYRISMTGETMTIERVDGKAKLTVTDSTYRGGYVTFGTKGLKAEFSEIKLSVPSRS